MVNICIVHYNTPLLTECLIKSINKFTPDSKIYIFDNSDKYPFTCKQNNIIYFDNTKGEIINFDEWLKKYPNREKSTEKTNMFGSAKHSYTVQKCIELINKNFILLDSDVLLKKDISDIIDENVIYSGEIVLQPSTKTIYRVLPYICFLNINEMKKHKVSYFNDNYMHGLYKTSTSDKYDTGGALFEEAKLFKHKNIVASDYVEHYKGGSWLNDNIKAFGSKISPKDWVLYNYDLWNDCEKSYKQYINDLNEFMEKRHLNFNIINPTTIQEKIQWMKIFDSTSLKTKCADKIKVHDYCIEKIGKDLCVPILKTYNSTNEIDLNELPEQFVLKCNHGSGMNIIVKDKKTLDIHSTKAALNKWMNTDFAFQNGFEMHYHDIERKIFAEKFIGKLDDDIPDYKISCFNGIPKLIQVMNNRYTSTLTINYYSNDFKLLEISRNDHPANFRIHNNPPKNLKLMLKYAKLLSKDFKYVRVDFYEIDNKLYLGELTFTPGSGIFRYNNASDEKFVGDMLDLNIGLPKNKKVIYTCITNNYDNLIEDEFYLEDYDYICFTNNENLKSNRWKIEKIPNTLSSLSPAKQARYIKTHPHIFLSNYELSVWIDGSIKILNDFSELINSSVIQIPQHPNRNCIYKEAIAVIKQKKDTKENVDKQIIKYHELGYPENYGLVQSNIIIRKHNDKNCIKLMEDWWNEIKNGSHRDQLSFNYVLWKNPNINISYLNKYIYNSKYFFWDTSHGKNKMNKTITTNFGGTYDIIGCKPIKNSEPVPAKTVVIPTPVKRIFY